MKCQILFTGKNKKNIISLLSPENAHRVVKVKAVLLRWANHGPWAFCYYCYYNYFHFDFRMECFQLFVVFFFVVVVFFFQKKIVWVKKCIFMLSQ